MLEGEIAVTGTDLHNETVRQTEVAGSREWRLIASESVDSKDGPHPIDPNFYVLAAEPDRLERAHLVFQVVRDKAGAPERLEIVLGTDALYSLLSGLPPPCPTSADEAYGGWRLP